ncbi:MAG: TolC family protein [Thermoguttaceae bacterium]
MTEKKAATPTIGWRARLVARLALLAVVCAGMDNRFARAQDAQGNGREVLIAPMPSDIPPSQDRIARAEHEEVITFPRALALASGQNPQIAFANEQVKEAFAQLQGARVLWLPTIRAGVGYINHDGPLQNSDGTITVANRSALEAGLGMYAVGGGAPAIPGVSAKFAFADAVFQPRITDQEAAARRHAVAATTNDLLLFTAVAYLDLLRAFQQQAIAQETLNHTERLAELTAAFARSGQGNQADADRAQTEVALRKNALSQAAAQTKVTSARLVELLHLEPTCVLTPQEPTIVPIELVSPDARVAQLVAGGLSSRPELAQSGHLVEAAVNRLHREQCAPLLPSLLLDVSQSGYGGGPDSVIGDYRGRFDFDAAVYWELHNFGLADAAAEKAARSRLEQSRQLQIQLMDRVAREIVEAHAQSDSLRGQIAVAQSGIRVASESYRRNLERIRGGQGLPLEVLQSLQALDQSCREYLRAVGDYDEWQFRLYRAMGCPIPQEASPAK